MFSNRNVAITAGTVSANSRAGTSRRRVLTGGIVAKMALLDTVQEALQQHQVEKPSIRAKGSWSQSTTRPGEE